VDATSLLPSPFVSENVQLKYNTTGREKDYVPSVGQWNMMNKVIILRGTDFHNASLGLCLLYLKYMHSVYCISRLNVHFYVSLCRNGQWW
jgi:hypothetical protein